MAGCSVSLPETHYTHTHRHTPNITIFITPAPLRKSSTLPSSPIVIMTTSSPPLLLILYMTTFHHINYCGYHHKHHGHYCPSGSIWQAVVCAFIHQRGLMVMEVTQALRPWFRRSAAHPRLMKTSWASSSLSWAFHNSITERTLNLHRAVAAEIVGKRVHSSERLSRGLTGLFKNVPIFIVTSHPGYIFWCGRTRWDEKSRE